MIGALCGQWLGVSSHHKDVIIVQARHMAAAAMWYHGPAQAMPRQQ
jgi:hypothetical protein